MSPLFDADKSNFGRRMLEKMGWGDGKGLGRKEDGMSTHIKIKKRQENLGERDGTCRVALPAHCRDTLLMQPLIRTSDRAETSCLPRSVPFRPAS